MLSENIHRPFNFLGLPLTGPRPQARSAQPMGPHMRRAQHGQVNDAGVL